MRAAGSILVALLCACGSGASSTPDAPVGGADARPADAAAGGADAAVADAAGSVADARPPDAAPPAPDAGITMFRGRLDPVVGHGEGASQGLRLRATITAEPTGSMSGPAGRLELGPR
jgi:hypothetical protein